VLMDNGRFQWSHFFSEMDRGITQIVNGNQMVFQWSHFFSEMDSLRQGLFAFRELIKVSMEPLLFRNE